MNYDQIKRCEKINILRPEPAAKQVFEWIKTGVIKAKEFTWLYPLIDRVCKCQLCMGLRGGAPGNENIVDGVLMCDYCHIDYKRKR